MKKRFEFIHSRQWVGLLLGLFIAVASVFMPSWLVGVFEDRLLDSLSGFRGTLPIGSDVVVVGIDDYALEFFREDRFPWPRSHYVEYFLKPLNQLGIHPSAIVFDMFFPEPEIVNDASFAASIKESGNVVIGYTFDVIGNEGGVVNDDMERLAASGEMIERDTLPALSRHETIREAKGFTPPVLPLAGAVAGTGFVNVRKDRDGVIRGTWAVLRSQGRLFPSLFLQSLLKHLQVEPSEIQVIPGDAIYIPTKKGTINVPIDEEGIFNVNFRGPDAFIDPPHAVPFLLLLESLGERLYPDETPAEDNAEGFDPSILDGKIVILGVYAEGYPDVGAVPTNSNYPLAALHANIIDNILTGDYLRPSKKTQHKVEIILLLFFGLAVGTSVRVLSPARGGISIGLLIVLYWFLAFYSLSAWNWVLPLFRPTVVIFFTYTANTLYHFMIERRQHRRAAKFLSSYVSKNVAKRLLESGQDISFTGQRALITTLFSDIRGFTSLSERLSPDEVVKILNEYFGEMTEVIFKNDGTLDKFMGDAIMVFFGHPDAQPDHALRALRTAVQMQQKMRMLQEMWTIEGRESIGIGIGINTGLAVVGNIGTAYKTEYTAIGDHVNVAFRLQGLAESGEILITEETYNLVKEHVEVDARPPVAVKGKSEPIHVYHLLHLRDGTEK